MQANSSLMAHQCKGGYSVTLNLKSVKAKIIEKYDMIKNICNSKTKLHIFSNTVIPASISLASLQYNQRRLATCTTKACVIQLYDTSILSQTILQICQHLKPIT